MDVDPNNTGKHEPTMISETALVLEAINSLGYCINNDKLVMKHEIDAKANMRRRLASLV